jgi:adenosylcobinamide-phosphate synthase
VITWVYPLFAFALDLVIGDPRWIPHPVVIVGKSVSWTESVLRRYFKGSAEKAAGVVLVLVIVIPTGAIAFLVSRFLFSLTGNVINILAMLLFLYLASTTLALRGLISSARVVMKAVERGGIAEARQKLAMIVGRDTDNLGEDAILRATIETVAENLSDGVIAPLFYLVVGGLPLAFAYKAINTLDSMVGYKNEKYLRLGWASARLDDLANYIPARITGLAIVAACFFYRAMAPSSPTLPFRHFAISRFSDALSAARDSFRIMCRDGRNHTSPNSGVPEAAMAGAIGVWLGGPSTYSRMLVEKPFIGDKKVTNYMAAARETLAMAMTASSLVVILSAALLLILRNLQ